MLPTLRLKPRHLIHKLLALSVFTACFHAGAQSLNHPEVAGSYMGLTYPQGSSDSDSQESDVLRPLTEDDTAMRLTVGQPWATGIHLEYGLQQMTLTSSKDISLEGVRGNNVQLQMGSISTMFFLPGPADVYPFVKLGVAAVSAGHEQEFVGTTISSVGVVVPLTKGWSARVELERIDRLGVAGQSRTQAYAGIQIPI